MSFHACRARARRGVASCSVHGVVPLALLLLASSRSNAADPLPGNVLVIIADDVGVDMLPAYGIGSDLPKVPVIDGLVKTGVLFRNAYAQPVCSPTRACIQTGRYPFRTGIGDSVNENADVVLRPEEITLPEMLDLGTGGAWSHALFGKWHLHSVEYGGPSAPNDAGWSHYEGAIDNLSSRVSNNYFDWQKVTNGVVTMSNKYATTDTVDSAISWLGAAQEPWLGVVAFHAAHSPWETPPAGLYSEDLTNIPPPSVEPRPYYKATLEAMDTELGRLIESFSPEVLSRTTVVFLGDNGTPGNVAAPPLGPGKAKGTVFEGGIRVPMIVTGPLVSHAGTESQAFVHAVDVFATVADLADVNLGATFPQVRIDGRSMVPYLKNPNAPSQRAFAFSEKFTPNKDGGLSPPSFLCQEDKGLAGPGPSVLSACGEPLFPENVATLRLENGVPGSPAFLLASSMLEPIELAGGMILPSPYFAVVPAPLDALGELEVLVPGGNATVGGPMMHCQVASASPALPYGWDLSNVVRLQFYDDPVSRHVIRNQAGMKLSLFEKQMKNDTVVKKWLYDLAADPLETTNLLSNPGGLTPEQAAALSELQSALDALLATGPEGS